MLCTLIKAAAKAGSALVGVAVVDSVLLNNKMGKALDGFVKKQEAKNEKH